MSEDALNSIKLWVGGIVFVVLFWSALHFDILSGVPVEWVWRVLIVVIAINVLKLGWDIWQRNSTNAGNHHG